MKSGTQEQAEGKFHQMKGKAKEMVGQISDNSRMEAEGLDEKIAGKVQNKVGQIKNLFEKE